MLNEQNEKKHVETCDVGLTCDIINESLYKPIIIAPTNPSCSTSTFTSSSSDGFTCDASLMVENETLKKEAKELLSTKRDWAISPRKARRPLLLTRLAL